MAVSEQKFQQVVLEEMARLDAMIYTLVELSAMQGEATNVQLNALMKAVVGFAGQGVVNFTAPALSLEKKYQEFYDAHYRNAVNRIASALRSRPDGPDQDEAEDVTDLSDILQ